MDKSLKFLVSGYGRIIRGLTGIAIALIGIYWADNYWQILLIIFGSIVFIVTLLDLCLLGIFNKSSLKGERIRNDGINKTKSLTTASILFIGVAAISLVVLTSSSNDNFASNGSAVISNTQTSAIPNTLVVEVDNTEDKVTTQNDLLIYLIEEEKLAHDVYSVMLEKYGAKVFGNIMNSETSHQSQVLSLLAARSIADPRSSEVGVFNNQELQNLYDSLIAQGLQDEIEAYKVGVAIEEKDIADITNQLSTAVDSDIIGTLETLRTGSENHLRAFNRQL